MLTRYKGPGLSGRVYTLCRLAYLAFLTARGSLRGLLGFSPWQKANLVDLAMTFFHKVLHRLVFLSTFKPCDPWQE